MTTAHLNLTRSLADVWGLTPEQVAAERARYGHTTLPQPFRRPLPEARVIEVVPVRKAYAGKESHPVIVESVK